MKRRQAASFIKHDRAQRFPQQTRAGLTEWDVTVSRDADGAPVVNIFIARPRKRPVILVLKPDDAYELREDIGRAIDMAYGL